MRFTTKLLPSRSGNLAIFELNHPKALHALTMDMIECFQDVLSEWCNDPSLKAILLKSRNDKSVKRPAFCAGGDAKAVYETGLSPETNSRASEFFYQEYKVNHAIATSKIPVVSLWNGVVMGGGAGISIHGKYRVATENSLFAMPETAIGLFPDVGSMFWMPRLLSRPMANYLALTGKRLNSADLLYSGLATHYIPSNQLTNVEKALVEATEDSNATNADVVAGVLLRFHESIPTEDCFLAKHKQSIQKAFQADSVEGILENLRTANDSAPATASSKASFEKTTLETLLKMSPTSMKVTLEGIRRGAACENIGEDLKMEYRMAKACTRPGSDFYEGVRAVLVDKDHSPKWNPGSVEQVTKEMVEAFFQPIENEWPIPASKL